MKKLRVQLLVLCFTGPALLLLYTLLSWVTASPIQLGALVVLCVINTTLAVSIALRFYTQVLRPLTTLQGELQNELRPTVSGPLVELLAELEGYLTIQQTRFREHFELIEQERDELKDRLRYLEHTNRQLSSQELDSERSSREEQAYLDSVLKLSAVHLTRIIGLTNRILSAEVDNRVPDQLLHYTTQLRFLLNDAIKAETSEARTTVDVRMIVDDGLEMVYPILRERGLECYPFVAASVPPAIHVPEDDFRALLFHYLLNTVLHCDPDQVSTPLRLVLTCDTDEQLHISIDDIGSISSGSYRRYQSVRSAFTDADLEQSLTITIHRADQPYPFPATGITAVIVTDNEIQRESLQERLHQLGMRVISDFKSRDVDICFVADAESDTFRAVQQYISPGVTVFLLSDQTLYSIPNWIQLRSPLNQLELISQIKMLERNERKQSDQYNVLAVDDSRPNLQLLVLQLEELGHQVSTANNGEDAVALCETGNFDLVFMDIQMPRLNGIEATRRIRGLPIQQPTIVGLTAHVSLDERQQCQLAGMDDVMVKPVRVNAIRELTGLGVSEPVPENDPPEDSDIFDLELSLSAANNRAEIADELFSLLVANLPSDQKSINDAFLQEDPQLLRTAVHKLLGAVRYCGVPRLATAVEKLEVLGKKGSTEDIRRALNVMNGEVQSLMLWREENPDPFEMRHG